ncbi:hypothetical protein PLEI_1044 [Photobacterium leiognathi lrivu.4.1]|uniref:YnhF family membrane protein n=1 Tax=Photobacterium leiognathi lrivu.4.1 TaxID=1248232 RepID=X0NN06_PHOLE|nr:hypothetical protein PLEI_1044 [Photobacterium leiognathi lrivu.4.1]
MLHVQAGIDKELSMEQDLKLAVITVTLTLTTIFSYAIVALTA